MFKQVTEKEKKDFFKNRLETVKNNHQQCPWYDFKIFYIFVEFCKEAYFSRFIIK